MYDADAMVQAYVNARVSRLVWVDDIDVELDPPWLVRGLLPESGLALVFGESGCGKTFFALDLAMRMASGMPWCEKPVRRGVVIYIGAENPGSVKRRAALWYRELGDEGMPFAIYPHALDLSDTQAVTHFVDDLMKLEVELDIPIAMVVVDTVARCMPGRDENSSQDMGKFIAGCDAIRTALTTMVCLIHHAGKDAAKGARGSSALRAAVDTEIEVSGSAGRHAAVITKQRDGELGDRFDFDLVPHVLGQAETGEDVVTCMVENMRMSTSTITRKVERLSPAERVAMDALNTLLDSSKQVASLEAMDKGAKAGHIVVDREAWRDEFYSRQPEGTSDQKRQAFRRVGISLQGKHRIGIHVDEVWLA